MCIRDSAHPVEGAEEERAVAARDKRVDLGVDQIGGRVEHDAGLCAIRVFFRDGGAKRKGPRRVAFGVFKALERVVRGKLRKGVAGGLKQRLNRQAVAQFFRNGDPLRDGRKDVIRPVL